MKDLLLISLLTEEYKLQNNCQSLPASFEYYNIKDKIDILIKSLQNKVKIEELLKEE